MSLAVIIGVLVLTVVGSLLSPAGKAHAAVANARRHAEQYLDLNYETDPQERTKSYAKLEEEVDTIKALPEKYKKDIRNSHELMSLLDRAQANHDEEHEQSGR